MPPKKKGPPYTDDPGCKYIVIEDPWPGNATGKARTQVFYNHLCTWVYFMLGKAHQVDAVYSVNTRGEVIVQLPQEVDLTPILGAHAWRKCLARGNPQDKDRVSYVFEYNYRNRGEPGNHNWLEFYPTVSGDPPPHLKFPVIYPYPRASYASPRGKNCADLALPLPPTRQPTPIPDTSRFEPYEHPSQISSRTVEGAHARPQEPVQDALNAPAVTGKLGKIDPYDEEAHALRSLKQEAQDGLGRVKLDPEGRAVKPEPELYGPSKTFRNAVERLQQARTGGDTGSTTPQQGAPDPRVKPELVKEEPELYGPSKQFRTAVERLQQSRSATGQEEHAGSVAPAALVVKAEQPSAPSREFVDAFQRMRGGQTEPREGIAQPTAPNLYDSHLVQEPHVKQDFSEDPPPPSEGFRAAFERLRGVQATASPNPDAARGPGYDEGAPPTIPPDPRLAPKRVKEEDIRDPADRKRLKSESYY